MIETRLADIQLEQGRVELLLQRKERRKVDVGLLIKRVDEGLVNVASRAKVRRPAVPDGRDGRRVAEAGLRSCGGWVRWWRAVSASGGGGVGWGGGGDNCGSLVTTESTDS